VKKAIKRIGDNNKLPDFTQYTVRHFMATTVRKLCPVLPREKRSHWLGHAVEGSRTTNWYEHLDPEYLEDVALATDYTIFKIGQLTAQPLFTVEPLLNLHKLRQLGADL
jgi:integrase